MSDNKTYSSKETAFILEIFHMSKNTYTVGQLRKLMEIIENTDPIQMQLVLASGVISDVFNPRAKLDNRFAIRKALGLGPVMSEPILLIVDYGQTLKQMIAAGRYNWKNDEITDKRFPVEGKGTVEFEAVLIQFDKGISSRDAKREIEEAGYEAGKIEHILSFGANYPEEQRKFPILGLGSVGLIQHNLYVPCLGRDDSRRRLGLDWLGVDWAARYRFLGVRKKVSQVLAS